MPAILDNTPENDTEADTMTLTQFKYVLEVAQTGSINQAASNLFVAQSVISNALKTLETELGQKIFFRSTKGIRPTPFGENFIANITPIQLHIDQLNTLLKHKGIAPNVSLSIASTGFFQMNKVVAQLLEKYKSFNLRIDTLESSFDEAVAMVANQMVNLAFIRRWSCYYSTTNKRLRSYKVDYFPINSYDMGITIGPGNPLFYSETDSVSPEMLKDYPCVMYNYLDSGPYKDIYERLKLSLSTRIVTNSRATMFELIADSSAYCFDAMIPALLPGEEPVEPASKVQAPPLRTLILEGCTIKTEYGWLMYNGRSRTMIEDECIDLVSQWLK